MKVLLARAEQLAKDDAFRAHGINNCPKRAWGDGRWNCVTEREGKGPHIIKLPKSIEEAIEFCNTCEEQLKVKAEKKMLKQMLIAVNNTNENYNTLLININGDGLYCGLTKTHEGDKINYHHSKKELKQMSEFAKARISESENAPICPCIGKKTTVYEEAIEFPMKICSIFENGLPCLHLLEFHDVPALGLVIARGNANLEKYR